VWVEVPVVGRPPGGGGRLRATGRRWSRRGPGKRSV